MNFDANLRNYKLILRIKIESILCQQLERALYKSIQNSFMINFPWITFHIMTSNKLWTID